MARRKIDRQLRLLESPIDQTARPVARVAIDRPLDKVYSYGVPEHLAGQVEAGRRVKVPFGRSERMELGMCVSVTPEVVRTTLRNIEEVLDDGPLLGPRLLELGEWISRYYCCPLGVTLAALVPAPVREKAGQKKARFAVACVGRQAIEGAKNAKRQAVMQALWDGPPEGIAVPKLHKQTGTTESPLKGLVDQGWVRIETRIVPDQDVELHEIQDPDWTLTADQTRALTEITAAIDRRSFGATLLFGVTGSGKTEVYVRAIRHVIAQGRQAILLIPEIALTTQAAQRLSRRFGRTAVLHASLSGPARARAWRAIAGGKVDVVVGTRSAVFAPAPNLGLIVVDEEQEGSFKNLAAPRYNTRDAATKRAQIESIPIVLGSATPSLETWYNCARLDHFRRIDLPKRVLDLPMPQVKLVDIRREQPGRDPGEVLLGRELTEALRETIDAGKQAVLLLNRRGYAGLLVCRNCGRVAECGRCQAKMVYHRKERRVVCHHCNSQMPAPTFCPVLGCGGPLAPVGMGTERVADELAAKVPEARIARMDSDALGESWGEGETAVARYAKFLDDFEAGRTDVLVGTQMIAKGLDFPGVRLVGIINADTALALPDFRAAERTFQLVSQVAGRAGRGAAGSRVIVQSSNISEPALQKALAHDYAGFAELELERRRQSQLPPIWRMVRIVLADAVRDRANQAAHQLVDQAKTIVQQEKLSARVLPAGPAVMERMRDLFRYDVRILAPSAAQLQTVLDRLRHQGALAARVRSTVIDVDPISLL